MTDFVTKDSGERIEYASGMRRDVQTGKPRYELIDRAFLKRWAELMARGADKYGADNWRLANSDEELARFKGSALRHLMQWLEDETDEDHAVAVAFNLAAAEYVKKRIADGAALARGYEDYYATDEEVEKAVDDQWNLPACDCCNPLLINSGSEEPDRTGIYRDNGQDGIPSEWSYRDGEWGFEALADNPPYWLAEGQWDEVRSSWSSSFPWTKVA